MNARRVRTPQRGIYSGRQPVAPRRRGRSWQPSLGLIPRRLIILGIAAAAVVFALLHLFAITRITVDSPGGGEVTTEVTKLVNASWSQSNMLTLNSDLLVSDLQQVDPLVKTASVRRQWPHGITLSVILKQPSLGWATDDQRYVLDKDGTAIGTLGTGSNLPVVTDTSNLPVSIGQVVAPAGFISFVGQLVPAVEACGYSVTGLSIADTTLDLTVSTNKGYNLIFDSGGEVSREIADLKAVQQTLVVQKKTPTKYIDLRILGRAYYM